MHQLQALHWLSFTSHNMKTKQNGFITIPIVIAIAVTTLVGGAVATWIYTDGHSEFQGGAPVSQHFRNLLPRTNQTYDLGTTSPALEWKNVYTKDLTVSGTCTGCGGGGTFAWTPYADGVATSTLLRFDSGFISQASSTISAMLHATGGITGALTGNADTATALAANGANCEAGNSPLGVDTVGAVESCFDVWTEAENTSAGYISATLTEEQVEDFAGLLIASSTGTHTGITVTYQDATSDVDFVVDVTGDWTGTFDGQEGSYYLDAINLTNFGNPFWTFFNATTTDALSEGTTNFYADQARWDSFWNASTTLDSVTTITNLSITESQISDLTHTTDQVGTLNTGDLCINDGSAVNCTVNTEAELETALDATDVIVSTEIDTFSEIDAIVADKNMCNLDDAQTFTGENIFSAHATSSLSHYIGTLFTGQTSFGETATSTFGTNGLLTLTTNGVSLNGSTVTDFVGDATISLSSGNLRVVDVNCTDCLNATEIEDIYLLDDGDTGTGAFIFSGASLEIPNAASPTVDAAGEIALDTTDEQLLIADSGNTARVFATAEFALFGFTLASTSPDFFDGGIIDIPKYTKDGRDITQFRCHVDNGTSVVVNISDGTNDTETITCATTQTSDTDVATNSTFTADELWEVQIGAITGTVDYLIFEAYGYITRE